MIQLEFIRTYELRMDSPLLDADIRVSGTDWQPALFSKRMVNGAGQVNVDGSQLALTEWVLAGNKPAFRAYFIDMTTRKIYQSPVIDEKPKSLLILGDRRVRVGLWNFTGPDGTIDVEVTQPSGPDLY